MKNKTGGVKKLLARESDRILPDQSVRENVMKELGFGPRGEARAYAHGGNEKTARNRLLSVCAAALALLLCVAVVLPLLLNGGGESNGLLLEGESEYARSVASVGALISSGIESSSAQPSGIGKLGGKSYPTTVLTEEQQAIVDEVEGYLSLAESVLSESSLEYATNALREKYEGLYDYAMTVSYTDLFGNAVSYTMYFNETVSSSKTNGDKVKTISAFTGILAVDGMEYPVTGGKEEKTEKGEEKTDIWLKAVTGDHSYILVERERKEESGKGETEGEEEICITVCEGGEVVERTYVSFEQETEHEKTEKELKLIIYRGGDTTTVEFEWKDGVLEVEYKDGDTKYSFTVFEKNGEYGYIF